MSKHQLSLLILACWQQPHWVLLNPVKRERMVRFNWHARGPSGRHSRSGQVGAGPALAPPGAAYGCLEGDRSKAGALFTIRAKSTDGYRSPSRTGTRRTRGSSSFRERPARGSGERSTRRRAVSRRSGHTR